MMFVVGSNDKENNCRGINFPLSIICEGDGNFRSPVIIQFVMAIHVSNCVINYIVNLCNFLMIFKTDFINEDIQF